MHNFTDWRGRHYHCNIVVVQDGQYIGVYDSCSHIIQELMSVIEKHRDKDVSDLLLRGIRVYYATPEGRVITLEKVEIV